MSVGHGYKYQCRIHGTQCPVDLNRLNPAKKALNLGSGMRNKFSDYDTEWVNLDRAKECEPDVVCNVGKQRLPFKDDTFDFVFSEHSLEHVPNVRGVLKELYRITKNGGRWKIIVPHGYNYQDNLFHETIGWHKNSFNKYLVGSGRDYYVDNVKLKLLNTKHRSVGWKHLLPFKKLLSQFLQNVYYEIEYNLEVVKQK